jgi:hypothetical protein
MSQATCTVYCLFIGDTDNGTDNSAMDGSSR